MRFYRRGSFLLNLLIFAFVSLLLSLTLGYDKVTKLVPLMALVPAVALSLYCLAGEFFPGLLTRTNVSLVGSGMQEIEDDKSTGKTTRLAGNRGLLIITGWLVIYLTIIVLFGFFIGMAIAIFIFLKFVDKSSWFRSLVITVAVAVVIYLTFNVLMSVVLFKGVIFGDLFIF